MTQPTKREQLAAMRLEDFKITFAQSLVHLQNKSAAHRDRVHCWCVIARRQREARRKEGAEITARLVAPMTPEMTRALFEVDRSSNHSARF